MIIGIRKNITDIMENETKHALSYGIDHSLRSGKVSIYLSHWGAPRFWTPKLIKKIERLGLKLHHFEAREETVVLAVFEEK